MFNKIKKGIKDERGAVLITVALTLTLMLFMVALVVDIGYAYHTKSKLQTASDSVALSVAHAACDGIADFNPQVYATQSSILVNSAKVYFDENGIDEFDEIFKRGKNTSDGNEFSIIWSLDKKDEAMSFIKDDSDAVLIFYKSTPTTDEVTGSRYIEIYTHLKNHAVFGAFSGYETFNLYAQSAAKCDYVAGGTPEALSYQILNLDPTEDFDITGPIENTFIKSITTFTEGMTNSALDFLQNNTYFISKYIMGGKTRMTCPNTSCSYLASHDGNAYVDSEDKFWRDENTTPAAPKNSEGESLDGYYCPYCDTECSTQENSNKVAVQLTTSAAVLNGVIHSNGGANIDIDTFRLRSQLSSAVQSVKCENCGFTGAPEEFAVRYLDKTGEEGSEDTIIFLCPECNEETSIPFNDYAEQNNITGSDDYFYYYATGSKEGKRPLLMVTGDYGTVKFTGRSKNAVYFAHIQNGFTSTIYKSKDQAAAWDLDRAPSIAQIIYNTPKVDDPLLISYVRERFNYDENNNLTNTINVNNIAKSKSIPYTQDTSSPAYIVSFGNTTDSGTNYSYDRSTNTLSISGSIADYTRSNQPPWCRASYKNDIKHILLNKDVYRIGDYAFFGLNNVESIVISDSITSIGKYAFNGCSKLTSVYVPSSVLTIDQRAFYNCGVNVFYGEEGSAIQSWCTTYRKTFSTEYTVNNSVVNSTNLTYSQVINPKDILGTYDLGNGKALPDVTDVYDNYYHFDFDFDNSLDSLQDVIDNNISMVENVDASEAQLKSLANTNTPNAVQKIIYNKRFDLSGSTGVDDSSEDTVRPIIDAKVTDITGATHSEALRGDTDPKVYYDIDIPAAVSQKSYDYATEITTLESRYISLAQAAQAYNINAAGTAETMSIEQNVETKFTANRNNIKTDLYGKDSSNNFLPNTKLERNAQDIYTSYNSDDDGNAKLIYNKYVAQDEAWFAANNLNVLKATHFTIGSDTYNAEDFINGRDGKMVYYNGTTPVEVAAGGNTTGYTSSIDKLVEKYIAAADPAPSAPTAPSSPRSSSFIPYSYFTQNGSRWNISGSSRWGNPAIVNQAVVYCSEINNPANGTWDRDVRSLRINGGVELYSEGKANIDKNGKGFDIQSGSANDRTYLYVTTDFTVGSNASSISIGDYCTIIVDGKMESNNNKDITVGNNSILYVGGDFNSKNGATLKVGNNSIVYINGNYNCSKSCDLEIGQNSYVYVNGSFTNEKGGTITVNSGGYGTGEFRGFYVNGNTTFGNKLKLNVKTNSTVCFNGTYYSSNEGNSNVNLTVEDNAIIFFNNGYSANSEKASIGNNATFVVTGNYQNTNGGNFYVGNDSQIFVSGMYDLQAYQNWALGVLVSASDGHLTLGDRSTLTAGQIRVWHGSSSNPADITLGSNAKLISTSVQYKNDPNQTDEGKRGIDCSSIVTRDTTSTISSRTNIYCGNSSGLSVANLFCETGTYMTGGGTLTINNRAVIGNTTSASVNVRPGAVLVTPSVTGSLTIGEENQDPTIVVIGSDINTNGSALKVFTGSTLYCGGAITASTLNIYNNTRIHSDGNISLSGKLDGANASGWVLSCKGFISSSLTDTSDNNYVGVGTSSYLFAERGIAMTNCDFTIKDSGVLCSGANVSVETLHLYGSSMAHVQGNLLLEGGILDGANASNWVLSVTGNITSTDNTSNSGNGTGVGCRLFCEGSISMSNCNYYNKGITYCYDDFSSGHFTNYNDGNTNTNEGLYCGRDITINGAIVNYTKIFAGRNISATRNNKTGIDNGDANTSDCYIVALGNLTQDGGSNESSIHNYSGCRIYVGGNMACWMFRTESTQYCLVEGNLSLNTSSGNKSIFYGQTSIGGCIKSDNSSYYNNIQLELYGSLTVEGFDCDNNEAAVNDPTLATKILAIKAANLDVYQGGKLYCRGIVEFTKNGLVVDSSSYDQQAFAIVVIAGGNANNSRGTNVLSTQTYLKLKHNTTQQYSGAQLYVDGNAYIGSKDKQSINDCSEDAFIMVTGTLTLQYGVNYAESKDEYKTTGSSDLKVNTLLSAGNLVVQNGNCFLGVKNMDKNTAAGTATHIGLPFGTTLLNSGDGRLASDYGNVTVQNGKLHIYDTAYIAGDVSCSGDFAVDDWARTYVGGDITAGAFYMFNKSELYLGKADSEGEGVDGDITTTGNVQCNNESGDDGEVTGALFCTGSVSAGADFINQGEASVLIHESLTAGGAITAEYASGTGIIFARDGIQFNANSINVYPIFYTDGAIRSVYGGGESTINAEYGTNVQYKNKNINDDYLINCVVTVSETVGGGGNSFVIVRGDDTTAAELLLHDCERSLDGTTITYLGTKNSHAEHSFLGHSCRTSEIKRNQTLMVVGYNLVLRDDIVNKGKIICLKDANGNGGNITFVNKINNDDKFTSLTNLGLVYCDGTMRVQGTNHGSSVGWYVPYGNSIKNGNGETAKGEIYVMGELLTYGSVDNFNRIYVGGDVHTTTQIRGTTEGKSNTDNNNGLDNENNSILFAGGSITADINPDDGSDTYYTAKDYGNPLISAVHNDESIIARSNSVLLALGNIRCTYAFIVGEARMDSTSTSSENGTKQFQWMNQQAYSGLQASKSGYIKTTLQNSQGSITITDDPEDPNYYGNYEGDLYDEYGRALTASEQVGKMFIYSPTANGRSGLTYNDFGFAYIGGTLTTSNGGGASATGYDGSHNFIRNFGKSVIYVANKYSGDSYSNPRGYAVDTGYTTLWPYSRMYVNGSYKNNLSPTTDSGNTTKTQVGFDAAFYSQLYVNGNFTAYDKIKIRDASRIIIAGDFNVSHSLLTKSYFELGKSPDEGERAVKDAWDENNLTLLQINGNFVSNGYTKIFERATMNVGGDFTNVSGFNLTDHYLTMRHHAALRVGGNAYCDAADIGSCSTLFVGKEFQARSGTIKIRDACDVSVGGNGGGDMVALSYIELGKREDDTYKYNSWTANRPQGPSISVDDIHVDNDSHFSDTGTGSDSNGDENTATANLICPNCGRNSSQTTFTRGTKDVVNSNGTLQYTLNEYTCDTCGYVFDETTGAFEDDGANGASVYVNGTINSKTGYLKLFANTKAYAVDTVRSYRYISLRHHAGLYVLTNTNSNGGTGSMFSYDDNSRLLDYNGNVVNNFYVDTNPNSTEYGNIYYYKPNQEIYYQQDEEGTLTQKQLSVAQTDLYNSGVRIYGFSVKIDESSQETFNGTASDNKTKGLLYQNMLYFYLNGEKVYPYTITKGESVNNEEAKDILNYAFIDFSYNLVQNNESGTSYVEKPVGTAVIGLPTTSGSIISYGDLTVNTHATAYATGDINSYGKTFIGDGGLIFSKGDYQCTSVVSLGSLFQGNNVCGFEMKHGHLYAAGNVKIYGSSEIGGGTIDAGKDITFSSVYTHYQYNDDENQINNSYTDPTEVDLFICSEKGNINFNSIYSWTGGITYAPGSYTYTTNGSTGKTEYSKTGGVISINGVYFEHFGSFIARDNNINAFYINLHRLANLKTLDLKTVSPSNVYLCPIETTDN